MMNISERYKIQISYRDLHTPYSTVLFRMILSDIEWFRQIFNDTKRRAVCLQQLGLLAILYVSLNNGP